MPVSSCKVNNFPNEYRCNDPLNFEVPLIRNFRNLCSRASPVHIKAMHAHSCYFHKGLKEASRLVSVWGNIPGKLALSCIFGKNERDIKIRGIKIRQNSPLNCFLFSSVSTCLKVNSKKTDCGLKTAVVLEQEPCNRKYAPRACCQSNQMILFNTCCTNDPCLRLGCSILMAYASAGRASNSKKMKKRQRYFLRPRSKFFVSISATI